MRLQFHKLSSLKTLNRLLLIDADKRRILSKSHKNPMAEFSYDSAHFVNPQVSLELLPVGNHFLNSGQNELSLQKNHKIASSSRPCQKQLSMILRLLLPQEQGMDAAFLKNKILQLIGFSLSKIISLPALLPKA